MEGLDVGSIPNIFLGRILIQLHIIQQDENLDLLSVISNALKLYGHTSNLDAFLNYCSTCVWEHYTVQQDDDWEKASIKKNKDDIVGIRFLIQSELVKMPSVPLYYYDSK
jgi:hypothetical protein